MVIFISMEKQEIHYIDYMREAIAKIKAVKRTLSGNSLDSVKLERFISDMYCYAYNKEDVDRIFSEAMKLEPSKLSYPII